jgi:hypothetical protein
MLEEERNDGDGNIEMNDIGDLNRAGSGLGLRCSVLGWYWDWWRLEIGACGSGGEAEAVVGY